MKMFKILAIGIMFFGLFAGNALADHGPVDAVLSWDANSESDLAGYRVYIGTEPGAYMPPIDVGNVTTFAVSGLDEGETFFAVTAYDASGNESGFSNEVSKVITVTPGDHTPPQPPVGLEVVLQELAQVYKHLGKMFAAIMSQGNLQVE